MLGGGTLGGAAAYAGIPPDGAGCAADDDGVCGNLKGPKQNVLSIPHLDKYFLYQTALC